jgi:hypothetical protein
MLDPASVQPPPPEIIPNIDFITANQIEAAALSGDARAVSTASTMPAFNAASAVSLAECASILEAALFRELRGSQYAQKLAGKTKRPFDSNALGLTLIGVATL